MPKVKFLQSTFVPAEKRVFQRFEEHEFDEKVSQHLVERNLVELVVEKASKAKKPDVQEEKPSK